MIRKMKIRALKIANSIDFMKKHLIISNKQSYDFPGYLLLHEIKLFIHF